ncbi:MAG TPA: hypothetical protein P5543_08720 [Planctomycetota bacterium]|nr:hypothetical protein [Planctomycetota bacterium]
MTKRILCLLGIFLLTACQTLTTPKDEDDVLIYNEQPLDPKVTVLDPTVSEATAPVVPNYNQEAIRLAEEQAAKEREKAIRAEQEAEQLRRELEEITNMRQAEEDARKLEEERRQKELELEKARQEAEEKARIAAEAQKKAEEEARKQEEIRRKANNPWHIRIIAFDNAEKFKKRVDDIAEFLKQEGFEDIVVRQAGKGKHWVVDVGYFPSDKDEEALKVLEKIVNLRYRGKKDFESAMFVKYVLE